MRKAFQVFQCTEKVFHAISYQLWLAFSFYVSLCEINCIKVQTVCIVLNLTILVEILSVLFTLTSSFASDWKKRSC